MQAEIKAAGGIVSLSPDASQLRRVIRLIHFFFLCGSKVGNNVSVCMSCVCVYLHE